MNLREGAKPVGAAPAVIDRIKRNLMNSRCRAPFPRFDKNRIVALAELLFIDCAIH